MGPTLHPVFCASFATLAAAFLTGCTGGASFTLVSTDTARIPRTEPLVVNLRAGEGYYWCDGEQITLAFADDNLSLIGEIGKKTLVASIVLEGLPADRARDYRLDLNSLRAKVRDGARHARYASLSGILALWIEDNGQVRGRFRALVKEQQFHVMLGWTGRQQLVLVGDFVAVRNRERTAELRRRSEADGLDRNLTPPAGIEPRPVTGPPVPGTRTDPDAPPPATAPSEERS